LVALAVASAALLSCFSTTSHLQRGEAYATGNPKYDDFFKEVIALRADAERAPAEEVGARADLVTALGLESKTEIGVTVSETRERAKKLRDYGVMLHLELTPDVKLVTAKGKQVDDPPPALVSGVVESTRKSLDLTRHLDDVMRQAQDLEKKRIQLRGESQDMFRALPQVKRDEIASELDSAQEVLTGIGETAKKSAGRASEFVVGVVQAVETGAAAANALPPPPPPVQAVASARAAPPKKTWKPVTRSTGPGPVVVKATTKPPPAAASKKKPKASDDFEP
jgi:hypothetical protein